MTNNPTNPAMRRLRARAKASADALAEVAPDEPATPPVDALYDRAWGTRAPAHDDLYNKAWGDRA